MNVGIEAVILISFLCFIFFIIAHLFVIYILNSSEYSKIIIKSFIISLLFLVGIISFLALLYDVKFSVYFLFVAIGVLNMACLFIVYMPFVFVISSSLSVDTIILIQKNNNAINKASLYRRFTTNKFIDRRLSLMQKNKLLKLENEYFYLTNRGKKIANFFVYIKGLFNIWPGG